MFYTHTNHIKSPLSLHLERVYQKVEETMKFLAAFLLFIYLSKALRLSDQFVQVRFQSDDSLYLNVTRLKTTFVDDILDCSFTCLQQSLCVSFNLAVFANSEGKFWCELLPSTRYRNPQKLTSDSQSRHFYIQVCNSNFWC